MRPRKRRSAYVATKELTKSDRRGHLSEATAVVERRCLSGRHLKSTSKWGGVKFLANAVPQPCRATLRDDPRVLECLSFVGVITLIFVVLIVVAVYGVQVLAGLATEYDELMVVERTDTTLASLATAGRAFHGGLTMKGVIEWKKTPAPPAPATRYRPEAEATDAWERPQLFNRPPGWRGTGGPVTTPSAKGSRAQLNTR